MTHPLSTSVPIISTSSHRDIFVTSCGHTFLTPLPPSPTHPLNTFSPSLLLTVTSCPIATGGAAAGGAAAGGIPPGDGTGAAVVKARPPGGKQHGTETPATRKIRR